MRTVQADSGSDSESRNKNEEIIPVNLLTPTVCTGPLEPATTIRTCTVKQRTFSAPTLGIGVGTWICLNYTLCADSRKRSQNLTLPALYVYPYIWNRSSATGNNAICIIPILHRTQLYLQYTTHWEMAPLLSSGNWLSLICRYILTFYGS